MKTSVIVAGLCLLAVVPRGAGGATISVAVAKPDLSVKLVAISSRAVVAGEHLHYSVRVTNRGKGVVKVGTNIQVRFTLIGKGTAVAYSTIGAKRALLNPGGSVVINWQSPDLMVKDTYLLSITVDPNKKVAESNETNNTIQAGQVVVN